MQNYLHLPVLVVIAGLFACQTTPKADKGESSAGLVEFSSAASSERLANADAKVDFFVLANHFEGQSNALFCGPTTAAIILNSFKTYKSPAELPKDRSRLSTADTKYLPKDFDPAVARYTQDAVVSKSPKSRASVFGKPVKVAGKDINDFGYQLRQFNDLLKGHGLKTTMRVADASISDDTVVSEMVANLKKSGDFVVVNYKRAEVGQQGGGHISPVGAYDAHSNSFLILDVNPAKASWVWMPAATLIKGMRSLDTIENRGYILVSDK